METQVTTNNLEKEKSKKQNIIEWICITVASIFWLISFFRVPYIGTFLDSVLFEFTLGFAKYALYLLLLIYILCIKIPKLRQIFCPKKRVIWYFIPIFILAIILNTIDCYRKGYNVIIARDLYVGENGYITNWLSHYWEKTVISFNVDYITNLTPQSYAFGGIIGLVIVFTSSYFAPIFITIVLVIIFVILGLTYFSKKYKNKKVKEVVEDWFKEDDGQSKKPIPKKEI